MFFMNAVMQIAGRTSPDDPEALRAIDLLYDTALISSGFTVSFCAIPCCNFWHKAQESGKVLP